MSSKDAKKEPPEVTEFQKELHGLFESRTASKSKVDKLTKLALHSARYYKNIVYCLEKFITRCVPEYKLTGLYVLDSICRTSKSIKQKSSSSSFTGSEYVGRFERNIEALFAEFCKVQEDKEKVLKRVVDLWERSGTFTPSVTEKIKKKYFPLLETVGGAVADSEEVTAEGAEENATEKAASIISSLAASLGQGHTSDFARSPLASATPASSSSSNPATPSTTEGSAGTPTSSVFISQTPQPIPSTGTFGNQLSGTFNNNIHSKPADNTLLAGLSDPSSAQALQTLLATISQVNAAAAASLPTTGGGQANHQASSLLAPAPMPGFQGSSSQDLPPVLQQLQGVLANSNQNGAFLPNNNTMVSSTVASSSFLHSDPRAGSGSVGESSSAGPASMSIVHHQREYSGNGLGGGLLPTGLAPRDPRSAPVDPRLAFQQQQQQQPQGAGGLGHTQPPGSQPPQAPPLPPSQQSQAQTQGQGQGQALDPRTMAHLASFLNPSSAMDGAMSSREFKGDRSSRAADNTGFDPPEVKEDPAVGADKIRVISRTLWVGGTFIPTISEQELEAIFAPKGQIATLIINQAKFNAFIKMADRTHAERCKVELDRTMVQGEVMKVGWGCGFGPRDCFDYTSGESIIPVDRLTDTDRRWLGQSIVGGFGAPISSNAKLAADPYLPQHSVMDFDEGSTPPADVEELYSSWALLILTVLLIGAMWTSYYLQVRKITAIHETVISIMTGMVVGFIIRVAPGRLVQDMVTFKHTYFFNLLLPPIILNSGYEMKQARFFRNLGSILTFAFVGTFISALVVGTLVYLLSLTGLESLQLSFLDSMIFGSVLSATDPVTILAIFNQLKVDPKLYSVIFGESILNDAVSIVMFETLKKYRGEDFHLGNVLHGVSTFFFVFCVSLMIGAIIGLIAALALKRTNIHLYPGLESCLIALMAYASYFFSNSIHLSGIVSLLFCGITLKHYAYESMSPRSKRTTKSLFQVLAQLSENFIFIYLGLTLFTETDLDYKPLFILFTFIFICISRYSAVFPLSSLINMISVYVLKRSDTLSRPHQVMLFWAGLRGAVAFALAAGLDGVHEAAALKTTILVVVVLSVIVFGGTTARMLAILGVKVGCVDSEGESDEDEGYEDYDRDREIYLSDDMYGRGADSQALYMHSAYSNSELSLQSRPSDEDYVGSGGSGSGSGSSTGSGHQHRDNTILPLPVAAANHPDDTHWFLSFDDRYLKPIFSRSRQWNRSRRRFSGPTLQHQRNRNRSTLGQHRGSSAGMTTATNSVGQFAGRHSRFTSSSGEHGRGSPNGGNVSNINYLSSHGSNGNLAASFGNSSSSSANSRKSSGEMGSMTLGDELGMNHVRRELDRRAAASTTASGVHSQTSNIHDI
ncbi:hypothetical protein KVV02_003070 [Mortierella alpina]|uniref:Sodium/hydrogen exchanger n=1 Tax=Mortierella alpina TaxID=64518 RepID=A0A9P8A6Y4_MORAP|nr:hypothetical protein KVV02_003070 [Mortierella alpina]